MPTASSTGTHEAPGTTQPSATGDRALSATGDRALSATGDRALSAAGIALGVVLAVFAISVAPQRHVARPVDPGPTRVTSVLIVGPLGLRMPVRGDAVRAR